MSTKPQPHPAAPRASGSQLASDDVGSIFVIPEDVWTTVSKRVGLVYLLEPITREVAKTIPEFPALELACGRWRTDTFWDLSKQSEALGRYCDANVREFSSLQAEISELDPLDPLPPPVHAQAVAALRLLDGATATCLDRIGPVTTRVEEFRQANLLADAEIKRYVGRFGPDWVELTASLDLVDGAIGLVYGAWEAIAADVAHLASGTVPITTALLLSLRIESALLSWQHIAQEVASFPSMAAGQERYLDGSYLTVGA